MKDYRFLVACLILLAIIIATGRNPHSRKYPTPTPTPTPAPSVTLAWDPVPDPSVQGYHLWTGFSSGGEHQSTDVGDVTLWTMQLTSATTYYFVVTAYNSNGDSVPSNEVSYTTP